MRIPRLRRRCRPAAPTPADATPRAAAAEPALADQPLDHADHRQHQHDQHRAVRDRDAVVAVDDAIDDVRRRPLVLGGDEEDHRRQRRHRAHEAVDERGDDRRLEQRQQDRAQRGEAAGAEHRRRLVEAAVDLAHRRHPGAHADRHVAKDIADDEDQRGAGDLDRRHVEREDVRDADHGAGNRERQHRAELERVLTDEPLAREEVGGQDAERGRGRRGDRRQPDGGPERVPRGARPQDAVRVHSMPNAFT